MIRTNKAIASIFRIFADKIENNTCETDRETVNDIANILIHIKLNIEETCHYLNVSRSTLQRMVIDGRLPHPRKTLGGDKYWWQDEIDEYMKEHNK